VRCGRTFVVDVIVPIFNEGRDGDRYTVEAVKHLIRVAKGEEEEIVDASPIASTPEAPRSGERKQQVRESKQRTRAVREARAVANGAAPKRRRSAEKFLRRHRKC
jgi:hypothetical protein